jgi:hypothetical protein
VGLVAIDATAGNACRPFYTGAVPLEMRLPSDLEARDPYARHRYESSTARLFQDFRIREHRILAEREAHG